MLVIGNGESRCNIDIALFSGPKIGCNAVFRDYYTEHLVCVDRNMIKEAQSVGVHLDRTVYTRADWNQRFGVKSVPDLPYTGTLKADEAFNWGSGPYAVLLAATLSKQVNLVGFDLYSVNDCYNNIYKDTLNYKTSDTRAVDPRYWIYQISKVFEHFPLTQFRIFQTDDWLLPTSWKKSNVTVDSISKLV